MVPKKQWMAIAVGGVISALLYALVTYGSIGGVLLAYFCQLPLYIIGLSMGTTASVIAGSIAAAGVIAVSGVLGAFIFLLVNAAPVVLLVRQGLLKYRMVPARPADCWRHAIWHWTFVCRLALAERFDHWFRRKRPRLFGRGDALYS